MDKMTKLDENMTIEEQIKWAKRFIGLSEAQSFQDWEESDKFKRFFAIVQDAAEKMGCEFFMDAGDGVYFETDMLEGEDLMGWLIPKDQVSAFRKEWDISEVDISDAWSGFYRWAIWENADDPIIKFELKGRRV